MDGSTWALESVLFLAFAPPQKEGAEILAGGHWAGLGHSSSLCRIGLKAPTG